MKLVIISSPPFLDALLPFVREISKKTPTHLFLEISPDFKRSNIWDMSGLAIKAGIQPAKPIFNHFFPKSIRTCWENLTSFNLIVHPTKMSLHPNSWRLSSYALSIIQNIDPDVIYCDDISPRMAIAIPGKKLAPIVMGIHDPHPHIGEGNWRLELTRKVSFPSVKRFILHNRAQVQEFANRYHVSRSDIFSIPLGYYDIYNHWQSDDINTDMKSILFFGRISPYKGIDTFINAAKISSYHLNNVRFVIAGKLVSGFSLPPLPMLENGCSFEVHNEYIPVRDQARLFRQSSIVVCPYTEATQSGVILTAYAFGKPVIATNVGGLAEYVDDNETGLLIPPHEPELLAKAIAQVLNTHKNWSIGITRYCQENVNWEKLTNSYLECFFVHTPDRNRELLLPA